MGWKDAQPEGGAANTLTIKVEGGLPVAVVPAAEPDVG
jgi:hypothetical protein